MESLFDEVYVNTQPLRKYEPLIRFDQGGNPQPRRPLDHSARVPKKPLDPGNDLKEETKIDTPKAPTGPVNDRKRPAAASNQPEPAKKKAQSAPGKQQKLTSFFTKKPQS